MREEEEIERERGMANSRSKPPDPYESGLRPRKEAVCVRARQPALSAAISPSGRDGTRHHRESASSEMKCCLGGIELPSDGIPV